MAVYRQIHTCFWEDTKVLDDMDFVDRYFFLYLLTNPHVNQSGCYEISLRQIINESGIDKKEVLALLDKFENKLNLIKYSEETKEILILKFYKYNWTGSPKVKTCIKNEISSIKSEELIRYVYGIFKKIYPMDTLSQEKEKEKEKEKDNKKRERENIKKREFSDVAIATTPSLSEISSYGASLGIGQDYCEDFYNHYEGIGWINGSGQEIKNWKAVFNSWVKKDRKEGKIGENKRYF